MTRLRNSSVSRESYPQQVDSENFEYLWSKHVEHGIFYTTEGRIKEEI